MKNFFSILIAITLLFPSFSFAEDVNAGFVRGLWYSSEPVFADVPTRIYVALRNNSPHDLTGMVYFSDNDTRIGSSEVNALSGRLVEAWIDWTPKAGEHHLVASLSNPELHIIGSGTEQTSVTDTLAEDTIIVDYDTDKDGIGNEIDTDNDNDGVKDEEEEKRGSDPLVANPKPEEESEQSDDTSRDEPEEHEDDSDNSHSSSDSRRSEGFEKYTDDGTTDTFLSSVSSKVENAKSALDTYRNNRNEEISTRVEAENLARTSTTTSNNDSGITRTKLDGSNKFLSSFVDGVASLMTSIWTFTLWVLSKTLSHPAVIQLLLLLAILYILYRLIRRVGRRPIDT